MKLKITIFKSLLLITVLSVKAMDYPYFVNENDGAFTTDSNGSRVVKPEKIEEAKKALDSQPAEKDPAGNWGPITDGLQTSIRFQKTTYSTNEEIQARIIMRNVSEKWRMFAMPNGLEADVTIYNSDGKPLERIDLADPKTTKGKIQRLSQGDQAHSLDAGMQWKLDLDIKHFFNLTIPGKYVVEVKLDCYTEDLGKLEKIASGQAVLIISNTAASSNASGTNSKK